MSTRPLRALRAGIAIVMAAGVLASAAGPAPAAAGDPIRIGALYPSAGAEGVLGGQEYTGVEIARDMVNAGGGVGGRQISLDSRELDTPSAANAAVDSLRGDGVPAIIGTYSSALSLPASARAAQDGVTYWESGAVADEVTGRGLAGVFRVGATGSSLGDNSADFTARVLAPMLHREPDGITVSVVYENDAYGSSVGLAAAKEAAADGLSVAGVTTYNAYAPDWQRVFATLREQSPTVVILASYVLDGVSFRRHMLTSGFHADALIGSTMAECYPDFGNILGADATGVFASDRPPGQAFNPAALTQSARAVYDRFAQLWRERTGIAPTEEGLAGFTAAWALFHDVLPRAGAMTSASIASAAMATVVPEGGLPNGAGLRFASSGDRLGQNLDAAAVIWQWQAVHDSVTVWPAQYANGSPEFVPLPR